MQEDKSKYKREDHGKLVDRDNLRGVADLQGPVVAHPGRARRQARQDQEDPALPADLRQAALRVRQEDHDPGHDHDHDSSYSCRQVGVDAFDTYFSKNGCERRKNS